MLLYRPVGLRELELVAESGWSAFPPRLAEQPIFYPVLSRAYAEKIAHDWNSVDEMSGFAGFVTEFEVPNDYTTKYEVKIVGGREHAELWIPAEDLPKLNSDIIGVIRAIASHYGPSFSGRLDATRGLPVSVVKAEPAV